MDQEDTEPGTLLYDSPTRDWPKARRTLRFDSPTLAWPKARPALTLIRPNLLASAWMKTRCDLVSLSLSTPSESSHKRAREFVNMIHEWTDQPETLPDDVVPVLNEAVQGLFGLYASRKKRGCATNLSLGELDVLD